MFKQIINSVVKEAGLLLKLRRVLSIFLLTSLFVSIFYAVPVMADFEKPPIFKAQSILKSKLLKGKYHTVNDQVKNDGLFNHYTIKSDFGSFKAGSTMDLEILVNEITAIADMIKVETDDTAVESLKTSGKKTVAGLKHLWNEPEETFKDAASSASSLFNRAKETVGERETSSAEDSKFEQLVGISKSKGMIATKYGVNVYSRNEILQEQLDRLGQADFAGGLGVGVASSFVPGIGGLILTTSGTARILNEAINNTPASKLWVDNKHKLEAMGIDEDTITLFLNNPSFSPALSTLLVTALDKMKGVDNRSLFIKVSLQASNPAMAKTITRISLMTAGYHKNISPLKSIATMARLTQGIRKDGSRIVLLPIDYITWSEQVADAAAGVRKAAKGSGTELWVLGSLSRQATEELEKLDWKIHTSAKAKLIVN